MSRASVAYSGTASPRREAASLSASALRSWSLRRTDYGAAGILLDAHAPGLYGGTGRTIDWDLAAEFVRSHPKLPLILAGGITPDNAAAALAAVHPAALDVASGSESAPGIKDFAKVRALLDATRT